MEMTGVILHAFNSVKNFVVQSLPFHRTERQQQNTPNNFNFSQSYPGFHPSRFRPFGDNDNTGRKRPAERLIEIELEITDDEDEDPRTQTWSSYRRQAHLPKRFKSLNQDSLETTGMDNNSRKKYITRSSGITPVIDGLEIQPWQFNFNNKKSPTNNRASITTKNNKNPDQNNASVEWSHGSLLKDTPTTSKKSQTNCIREDNQNQGTSQMNSTVETNAQTDFRSFQFEKPSRGVEVITLYDDDAPKHRTYKTPYAGAGPSAFKKTEEIMMKSKKPMKATVKQRFSNAISNIGRKSVDPISSSIRLEEMNAYKQLIQKMSNIKEKFSFNRRHLQHSKMDTEHVKAVYHNWTNTSPSVTLETRFRRSFTSPLSSSTPKLGLLDRVGNDLRLFSTPSASRSSGSTPVGPPTPVLIDLEEDEKERSQEIVVNGPCTGIPTTDASIHSSFMDLNDALNSNPDVTYTGKSNSSESKDLEYVANKPCDDDISILSERISNKFKGKRMNSLELEQNLSPYINRHWLDDLSTSWRENKKFREKQIEENLETIDILNKESTLENDLRERMRKKLTLTEIIVLEEPVPTLPEITDEMQIIIDMAKRPGREDEVLAQVFNIDFTRGDVKTLGPCKWLNDNVINLYMELIAQRSKEGTFPKAHVFTTFFYPKLLKEGYSNALKRWTRKVDIFSNDLLIFPIHLGLHWCLACADFRNKSVYYYDSLGGRNDKCLNALLNYLSMEMRERKGTVLQKDEWELKNVEDIPQQQNGSDCGVFTCKFAEYLSRDAKLTFLQENMNYYRDRMIYEIIKKDLLYP